MPTKTDEGRTRAPRGEQVQERRKQRDSVIGQRLAVSIPPEDLKVYKYRIINDKPARIFAKTKQDDWDIVHQEGGEIRDESDMGSAVSFVVGTHPDGSAMRAYLCRKRKDWWEADQEEKTREIEKQLAELRRGNDADGAPIGDYTPRTKIRI